MNVVNLILFILFGVASVTIGVLVGIFVLPEKRKSSSGFICLLKALFNFKFNLAEKIIKVATVIGCVFSFSFGLVYTFTGFVDNVGFGSLSWEGYNGIRIMICGTVGSYVGGSLLVKLIHMADNMIELNKKTARTAKEEPAPTPAPAKTPVAAPASAPVSAPNAARFCGRCGSSVDGNGKCPNCDK